MNEDRRPRIDLRVREVLSSPKAFALIAVFVTAFLLRNAVIGVGAPYITIDDETAFEAGFLVWFGQAPPQRMYVESWLYGITCLSVYLVKSFSGLATGQLGINFVAEAYRDFTSDPRPYVLAFRWLTLLLDLVTAWFVYLVGRRVLGDVWKGWAAVAVSCMFLLSYNTIWSGIVARPDSLLTLFAILGLWLYLRSDSGRSLPWLISSAVLMGIAAGQKLHGAFLAIFVCFDLLRIHGLRQGLRSIILVGGTSFFFFLVFAGSPLFDPLTYVKLRMANYADDHSPWIQWGDQFVALLRGAGWLIPPVVAVGVWFAFARSDRNTNQALKSCAVIAMGWLLLFASIRQLRSYWMLPALPVFYVMAIYAVTRLRSVKVGAVIVSCMLAVLAFQSAKQIASLRSAPYTDLRDWVVSRVGSSPLYILGYDALTLPKNTSCIERTSRIIQLMIEADRADGLSFTERHLKNWEERSTLRLFDFLENRFEPGFEFYDVYSTPPAIFERVVGFDSINVILVQEGFGLDSEPMVRKLIESEFEKDSERTGAGGGDSGLKYTVYVRR